MTIRNIELPLGKTRIKANGIPPRITYIHDDSVLLGQVFVGDYVRSLLSPTVQVINIQDTPTLTFYLSRLKNVPRTLVVSSRKPTTTSGNCRIDISLPAGHVGLTFERRQSDNSVIVRRVAHDSPVKRFVEPQSVVYGVKLSTHQSVVFSNGSAHEIARAIGEHRHLPTRVLMLSSIPAMEDRRQAAPSASIRTTTTDRQAAAHDILFEPSVMMMAEDNARRRDVDDERSLVSATVILEDQSVSAEDPSTLANWPDNNDDSRRRLQAVVPLEHSARRCRRGADDDDEETLSPVAVPVRSSFVRDEPLAAVVSVPPFLNDRQDASVSPQRRAQSNPYDDVDTISPVATPVTPSDGSSDVNHRAPMVAASIPTSPSVSGSSISEGGAATCSTEINIKGGTGEAQHIHIKLKPNEHVFANPDCLVYMTNGIRIEEESESDPTVLRRFLYTNDDAGEKGTLVLGSSTPCKMFSVRLESQGRQLICQHGAVVCCDSSVECTMLEDGDREDLLRLSGEGCVYLRAAGSVLQHHLEEQEVLECSPGALLAFENTVSVRNASLSGSRLVMVQMRGPGMVWMSTSPTSCSSSLRFRGIDNTGIVS